MEKSGKPVLRDKVPRHEGERGQYRQPEKLADGRRLTLSPSLGELALTEPTTHSAADIVLAEVLGVRMLLLNTVPALGKEGEATTATTMQKMWQRSPRRTRTPRRSPVPKTRSTGFRRPRVTDW